MFFKSFAAMAKQLMSEIKSKESVCLEAKTAKCIMGISEISSFLYTIWSPDSYVKLVWNIAPPHFSNVIFDSLIEP